MQYNSSAVSKYDGRGGIRSQRSPQRASRRATLSRQIRRSRTSSQSGPSAKSFSGTKSCGALRQRCRSSQTGPHFPICHRHDAKRLPPVAVDTSPFIQTTFSPTASISVANSGSSGCIVKAEAPSSANRLAIARRTLLSPSVIRAVFP